MGHDEDVYHACKWRPHGNGKRTDIWEETNPQIQRSASIPGRIRKKKKITQLKTKDKRWAQSESKKIRIRFLGTTGKLRSDLWKLGWIQKIIQGHPVSKTDS